MNTHSGTELQYTLKDLLPIGLTFVVTGIVLAFGLNVSGDVRDDLGELGCGAHTDGKTIYDPATALCKNSSGATSIVGTAAFNSSTDTIQSVSQLTSRMDTLALVTIAAVIIGVLLTAFAFRQ